MIDKFLNVVTPARVTAAVAYVVGVAYPGINPDIRGAIVGAVTGLYVLGVTLIECAERKHGVPQSSRQAPASVPRNIVPEEIRKAKADAETKVIR